MKDPENKRDMLLKAVHSLSDNAILKCNRIEINIQEDQCSVEFDPPIPDIPHTETVE